MKKMRVLVKIRGNRIYPARTKNLNKHIRGKSMLSFTKTIAGASLYSLAVLLSNLILVLTPGITWAEGLQEVTWGDGKYGKNPVHYVVTNSTEGEKAIPKIKKMVLFKLELVFNIKDVTIKENSLSFTIYTEDENQICTLLKQENGQYVGTCKSDDESNSSKSIDISMRPPVADENESPEPESMVSP
ncbi:MAG: hypothetical protein GY775_18585 [Candidatus Scalindua sp.]|nr:hypothetical protein [Candidatus Scalindua sp.]